MALNIVRVRIFWTSNIFVIIVFPYTHDTGAVTGTELGVEIYTLPLIEINIAAFQPFNTALFKTNFNFTFFLNWIIRNWLYLLNMRNTLKKMAELTYAELTQGRESTHLPHTHKLTLLENVVISALHKIDKRIHIQD